MAAPGIYKHGGKYQRWNGTSWEGPKTDTAAELKGYASKSPSIASAPRTAASKKPEVPKSLNTHTKSSSPSPKGIPGLTATDSAFNPSDLESLLNDTTPKSQNKTSEGRKSMPDFLPFEDVIAGHTPVSNSSPIDNFNLTLDDFEDAEEEDRASVPISKAKKSHTKRNVAIVLSVILALSGIVGYAYYHKESTKSESIPLKEQVYSKLATVTHSQDQVNQTLSSEAVTTNQATAEKIAQAISTGDCDSIKDSYGKLDDLTKSTYDCKAFTRTTTNSIENVSNSLDSQGFQVLQYTWNKGANGVQLTFNNTDLVSIMSLGQEMSDDGE